MQKIGILIRSVYNFGLRYFDNEIFRFSLQNDDNEVVCNIDYKTLNNSLIQYLPLEFGGALAEEKLLKWLKHRIIPSNRYYVKNFLAKLGLNEDDLCGILSISYGLSLNDCYWICPDSEKRNFQQLNLFDNRFSAVLGAIAFTGYGNYIKTDFKSSPEFTTNGMLAKAWRRINGELLLYKSGTVGAANTGNEPYSEFYASQIANAMGINAINYGLSKWKGRLCSVCKIFSSKDYSFVPMGNLLSFNKIDSVLDFYRNLGEDYYNALVDMFVFDAVILNQDRHLGNFGFLVDNRTNTISAPAPIFDNGLSLFCYAMDDDIAHYTQYTKTIRPSLYPDFVSFAKRIITPRQRKMLLKLVDFKFKKHPRYNLPDGRLAFLEKWVRERAKEIVGDE